MLRIVIADPALLERAGVCCALEDAAMAVVAQCDAAGEAWAATRELAPDVLLLSAVLLRGGDEGYERAMLDHLTEASAHTEVVVLLDTPDMTLMLRLVRAGVSGILLGSADPVRLPHALAGVVAGETAFPRVLVRAMADELVRDERRRHPTAANAVLTTREIDVLEALGRGCTATEAASRLRISHATVRRHVANAMHKLDAPDRASAIRLACGDPAPRRAA